MPSGTPPVAVLSKDTFLSFPHMFSSASAALGDPDGRCFFLGGSFSARFNISTSSSCSVSFIAVSPSVSISGFFVFSFFSFISFFSGSSFLPSPSPSLFFRFRLLFRGALNGFLPSLTNKESAMLPSAKDFATDSEKFGTDASD